MFRLGLAYSVCEVLRGSPGYGDTETNIEMWALKDCLVFIQSSISFSSYFAFGVNVARDLKEGNRAT
jgi:hypothetical protein